MKYSKKMLDIEAIGITIASGKEIRSWAERKLPNGKIVGEVSSADTVRLKNLKPIKDGLFCERIFGPVNDFVCSCGKYHKMRRMKQEKRKQELFSSFSSSYYCRQCEVAITKSKERRYRLGYIRLHSLVTHLWFFKDRSANPLPDWVEIDKKLLELISYCAVEFVQYNYPHTSSSKKWYSNSDPQNHNIGLSDINFSNYFFIQFSWLSLFQVKSDFFWFTKLYAQKKKNLFNTIKLKKLGVKKNIFLKKKRSTFLSKSTFLKYSRSNLFLFPPQTQPISFSKTSQKILLNKNYKLTKQKKFLLKITKITLVSTFLPFEKPLLFIFLFHFFKNFFCLTAKNFPKSENNKKNNVLNQFQLMVLFFTDFEKNKQFSSFEKNSFLTPIFSKKIIIGNCFKKKEENKKLSKYSFLRSNTNKPSVCKEHEVFLSRGFFCKKNKKRCDPTTKRTFQEKKIFSASKLDQYPFHKYTNFIISSSNKNSTFFPSLWKKFCIFLVLGNQTGCWVLKKKKKSFVYKFFIPQITLLKKKIFNTQHQQSWCSTSKIKPRFVFSAKLKNNILQKQKFKFLKQNYTSVKTTEVHTNFYTTRQNKNFVSRFIKSIQHSKFDFLNKKKIFSLFGNRKQNFFFKNSRNSKFFQSLIKSKFFFHFIIFQKIDTHNFKKVEKKLWWWFFLNQKKKNSFQHWKNSFIQMYSYNDIAFFYQTIFFDKKKISSGMPNFFSSHSVDTSARLVLNSTKTNSNIRNGKKTKITLFLLQKKPKNYNQTKLFNHKKERYKKRFHEFIIQRKKSKIENEKIKIKSSLFLLSNFLYHRGDVSSFQLKEKVQNRLTYDFFKNSQENKNILKKIKKNKNVLVKSIFYYENMIKKQVFQLALSIFSKFFILYSYSDQPIDTSFFYNPKQIHLVLNSSYFFKKKKYKKFQISTKKTKLHKKFLQSMLIIQINLEHGVFFDFFCKKKPKKTKKNLRKKRFSNSLKYYFEGIENKFTHSQQRTQPLLQKKKTIQIFRSDFQTNYILNKTKVFFVQFLFFSSKLFLKLWNKKNCHKLLPHQFRKKNKSFFIFLFLKKLLKTSFNLNQLLGFKNFFNSQNLLKTLSPLSSSIYSQKQLFNDILKSEKIFLPIRSHLKLMKKLSPFNDLQMFHGTKSIKNFKLSFLHLNLIPPSKTSSFCFSTLKTKPYKIKTNTSTFSSYLFFFYFNIFLLLFKNLIFEKVSQKQSFLFFLQKKNPLYDGFIYQGFQLKKKNLFVEFYLMKFLQKKNKKLQNQSHKNRNFQIRHKFLYLSVSTKPLIFWFFETVKSSFFLMFFIESFVNATQSIFFNLNTIGLTKTGPQALFYLLNRYVPSKGRVSSNTLIDLNISRKKLSCLPFLVRKGGFLGRKSRFKPKQALSNYRQANRMVKILEEFPNVEKKKRGPHILSQMFLSVIPVLPPTLRPIIPLPGKVTAISDLNRLYQRILYRNNRFLKTPEPYYAHRILQEAVDALIENGKSGSKPVSDQKNRPYKSLSDILKGKQGRFRFNLLGKRVDYSGRSVIVVGPQLHIHECGLPKQMAIELFQPFLLRALKNFRVVTNIFQAKKLIEKEDPIVWKVLHQILPNYPLLLNRAPTLHRLGIQAFQPKLVSGQALLLHPLVCTAFNADFDGDQMAVHIPLSIEARSEAWNLMWSRHHLFSAATGQPIIVPSQDMVLGVYFLTTNPFQNSSRSQFLFNTFSEVVQAYENHQVQLQASVWVQTKIEIETGFDLEEPLEMRLTFLGASIYRFLTVQSYYNEKGFLFQKYICTTPGRILMNQLIALN